MTTRFHLLAWVVVLVASLLGIVLRDWKWLAAPLGMALAVILTLLIGQAS